MTAIAAFLLAFPAFFSIVNPPGAALIFNEFTPGFTRRRAARLANRVALYSLRSCWWRCGAAPTC